MTCPLCRSNDSQILRRLEAEPLIEQWRAQFGMDIRSEFSEVSALELRTCRVCGLEYFSPPCVAGSASLYEQLEKFDWYYMRRKWEHDVALQDMDGCKNGIEVGCGFGDFVARVVKEKAIPFEGCEQNPGAVQVARAKGVPVHLDTLESLANLRASSYDVVCSFQVLEHVARPGSFLDAACALLRPGGKLILGLPNAESFLKHQFNLLDLPPHHMSRWTDETLTFLQQLLPLKLARVAYEPLADYHIDEYAEAYASLLATRGFSLLAMPRLRSWIRRCIRMPGVRKALRGQTIYACYVRA